MPNNSGDTQVYEIGYLILPSIPEDRLSDVVDSIRGVFAKEGGTEIDAEAPFKHPLAYSMSKTVGASRYVVSDAYLGWIKFDLPAGALEKAREEHPIERIKTNLEKIGEILRFLLIKAPRETSFTFTKAMAAAKDEEKSEAASPAALPVVQ